MSCNRAREDIVGVLEGNEELRAHVAGCDDCRDAVHAIEGVTAKIAVAGDDFVVSSVLYDRIAELAAESDADRVSVTRVKTEIPVTPKSAPAAPTRAGPSKRSLWLLLAACLSVTGSVVVGLKLADLQRSPAAAATRAWHGKVAKIARSGADAAAEQGIFVLDGKDKKPLLEGAEVKAGMHIGTDGKTRARIWFEDGTTAVLDRATDVTIGSEPRTMTLHDGAVLTDVAHIDGAPPARIQTPNGWVKVLGTKLSLTATADRTNVEVLRGEVEVGSGEGAKKVSAGQEGVVGKDGKVDVAPANDLAQRSAFGEQLIATHNEDTEAPASGLGELRAKRPGRTDEKDHAVRLASHAVKVRVAGTVARTEIDETFANDTDDELEGIYRFPLPPGAQIERLALEVDGKLVEGEFIDKAKASAIWRGAIQNAAPKAPKPKEEIIWVPGRWHDPALLEWQRGGRFELRIFPIPKKGSRRVIIAYTETVAPVSGIRRYVYPLPQGASSNIKIDQFTVDAQVLGHDAKVPVRARGYELDKKTEGAADRLTASMQSFVPSGDLAIEYGMDDKATDATAWGYRAEPIAQKRSLTEKDDPVGNDPFVAIALRPKLPKWSESKPRDQVIVVDAGRTMYGERFARAKRLAVQMTQEMDRRDRVTVITCDVGCKSLPGGFVAPGAPGAHDVDAFLTGISPDGASDLVGAVRSAAKLSGRDSARDLRVAVLSDGVATAGYRSSSRVASEVSDALGDPRALVVSVPIGADADVALLGDLARGGGGVVVPYQPGQRLEASAIEVLNATYGTTLRDVEVVLPEGLRDSAPAVIAPLRAGSETIITARMSSDNVKGDLILRGKVGGDPFEAKYPIEVKASTDAGNAFVPRLFAAARIADRERTPGANGAELVALSHRFAVPAKSTSLLVLESEAMFKAFGINRAEHGPRWTGESLAQGTTVATTTTGATKATSPADTSLADSIGNAFGEDEEDRKSAKADKEKGGPGSLGSLGGGFGGGGLQGAGDGRPASNASPPPAPAATRGPVAEASPAKKRASLDADEPRADALSSVGRRGWRGDGFGGRFMKKVFVRHATLTADATPAISAEKVSAARAAVAAAPDERSKHKELAKVLALSGQLDELEETLTKWSERDPLDFDVIVGRAEIAARRGNRDAALRIMGGALAANALSTSDAYTMAQTVARSFERVGRTEGCAFHIAAAELKPTDPEALGWAISCERTEGRPASADRWLVGLKDTERTAVTKMLTTLEQKRTETANGDIVVTANWTGGADLDLAIVDPSGRRCAAVTRLKNAKVEGATARDHESLAMTSFDGGAFAVEVVRASAVEAVPVSGNVTIKAFGQTKTIPFTLTSARTQIGRVDVRWDQELVPVDGPVEEPVRVNNAQFDRNAAAAALSAVNLHHCSSTGQVGTGHATITFSPTGGVSQVIVDDPGFSGTPAGRCVQTALFNARVPAFTGAPVRVAKSFSVQ